MIYHWKTAYTFFLAKLFRNRILARCSSCLISFVWANSTYEEHEPRVLAFFCMMWTLNNAMLCLLEPLWTHFVAERYSWYLLLFVFFYNCYPIHFTLPEPRNWRSKLTNHLTHKKDSPGSMTLEYSRDPDI